MIVMRNKLLQMQKDARALHLRLSILEAEIARQKKWEATAGRKWK